jgi:hypothetical protein
MDADQALRAFKPQAPGYRATGPGTATLSEAEQSEMLADIWQNASVQLDSLSRENRIRYFHFLQPNQYLPGAKPMGASERRAAFDPSHPYRVGAEDGYPRLMQRGRKLVDMGVHFLDLTSIFADVTDPSFVDTCWHINRRGNALLAAAMARSILSDLGDTVPGSP